MRHRAETDWRMHFSFGSAAGDVRYRMISMFHWAVVSFVVAILAALFGSVVWLARPLFLLAVVLGLLFLFHQRKPPY